MRLDGTRSMTSVYYDYLIDKVKYLFIHVSLITHKIFLYSELL